MAVKYFIGSGDNFNNATKWSTTSGGANDTTAPTTSDIATFDSNSGNCTFSANVSVLGMDVQASYASTITQGTYTYTIGTSKHIQAGGTFLGGSGAIDFSSDMNLNGGTFQSTSGIFTNSKSFYKTAGTFTHNSGTYRWYTSSHCFYESNDSVTFYNMIIEKNVYDLTTTGSTFPPSVISNLSIKNGFSQSSELHGEIKLIGDASLNVNGGLFGGGVVSFEGVDHTWTVDSDSSSCSLPNVEIDCNSVTFVTSVSTAKFSFRTLTWTDGTLIDLDDKDIYFAHAYQTPIFKLKGLLTFRDLSVHGNSANNPFQIEDLAGNYTGQIQIRNMDRPFFGGCTIFGDTIFFSGNWIETASYPSSYQSCIAEMNGTGDQYIQIDPVGRMAASTLVINKPSGAWKLVADFSFLNSSFSVTMDAGEIELDSYDLTISGDYTQNNGTFSGQTGKFRVGNLYQVGGIFNEGSQGILMLSNQFSLTGGTFNRHASGVLDTSGSTSATMNLNANGNIITNLFNNRGIYDLNMQSAMTVAGNITYMGTGSGADQIGTGSLYWQGDFYYVDGQSGGLSTTSLIVNGTGNQTIHWKKTSAGQGIGKIDLQKASGTLTFLSNTGLCTFGQGLLVNMTISDIVIPLGYALKFQGTGSNSDFKSNGLVIPGLTIAKNTYDLTLIDDLEIIGNYENRNTSSTGQLVGIGRIIEIHGTIEVFTLHSALVLSSCPEWRMIGVYDQSIKSASGILDSGKLIINKDSGVVRMLSDITIDNSTSGDNGNHVFTLTKGVLCTNGYDLTVDGTLTIGSSGVIQKVPPTVITQGTLANSGSIVAVSGCTHTGILD